MSPSKAMQKEYNHPVKVYGRPRLDDDGNLLFNFFFLKKNENGAAHRLFMMWILFMNYDGDAWVWTMSITFKISASLFWKTTCPVATGFPSRSPA